MGIFLKRTMSLLLAFCILAGAVPPMALSSHAADLEDTCFAGKTVSILGDSISTMGGVSNSTSANSTLGNSAVYYSGTSGVMRHDTWWQQTIDALDMELLVNNSWSGSCVLHTRSGTVGAYLDRCVQLHNDTTGEEPDVILVFLGTNDFSYYQSTLGSAEIDYDTLIAAGGDGTYTYASPATTCEAYAIMLHKMAQRYPDAEIYCLGMTARRSPDKEDSYADVGQPTAFNAQLQEIIGHFGFTYVDLENCGIDAQAEIFDMYMADGRVHPNALGMDQMTKAVVRTMLGREVELCSVSGEYKGVTTENAAATVISGEAYRASLALQENYFDLCVTVTMGEEDITASCFENGEIFIPAVTGDVVITATANREPQSFKWEYRNGDLISTGNTENILTKLSGSCSDGVFTDTRYQLTDEAVLRHDLPWVVEWKGEGAGGFMLSQKREASAAPFFFRRAGNYLNAFGTHDGSKYNNYGLTYSDGASNHTYRLENRIAGDGSNMVYLLVDGAEIGAMTDYYVAGTAQGTTGDWICGQDFSVKYLGSSSHPLTDYAMEYLLISECVHTYENGICTVCGAGDLSATDWMGASAVFLGDSITYGTGTDKPYYTCMDEKGVFQSVLAMGVAGSCISSQSDYGSGNSPLIHRYSSIPDSDLIVVFMGTNDYGHETPLGSPSDTTDVSFYGALNVIIPGIQAQHPDSQLVFVTPLHRYGFGSSKILGTQFTYDHIANGRGHTLSDYVDAIKAVCAKYSVPIIDLYKEYPVDPSDSADRVAYMPDGLHPNAIGHEMIADLICRGLLTIPNKNADGAAGEEDGADVLLQHGNKFVSSYANDPTRASSITNLYLSKGQTVTFKLPGEYVWALAKTDGADSTHYSRYYPENGWNSATFYTVAENGYYGLVLKKCDESAFDFDNRDSDHVLDYILVEDPNEHKHAYTAAVTAPTCTEQGYTTYTCACGDGYVADYVNALGHTYENGICTACGDSKTLENRTISILGASISTYAGISNNTAYNATIGENAVYYTEGQHGVYSGDTWWMQAANDLGLELLVNNSWSGSSLLYERNGTVGAYVDRCVQLHNNEGETPDIIAIQMGTNDFQYYKDTLGTADINYAELIVPNEDGSYTYAKPTTSLEAAAIVLHKISIRYPDAEVYYLNISQRVDGTDDLIRSFNAELKQVVEHFDAHIVDIYGSVITMDSFDTYIGDGRVHPNKLGMDAYTEAFKRSLVSNTEYIIDTHTVTFQLDGVTADYGDNKIVVSGDSFSVNLTSDDTMHVTVTMGGKDITSTAYANGTVSIDSVTADVTISADNIHIPQNYFWTFDGTDLACAIGENALTKIAGTTTDGVFTNTAYALEKAVVLESDKPWSVEWLCEGTFQNSGSSTGARIFTSTDVNAEYNARYIFKSNKNGLIAMGEKTSTGSHNYGIALGDHGIDWTEPHTYRLENRIAADGSNMVYLFVDGIEIGPMNHYYLGTTDQNAASNWISGKNFVFPYMGTDTHGFTNASIAYIRVMETAHTHTYENGVCTICGGEAPNPYAGKTIACIGDSITYGVGVTRDETDYVTLLAQSLEMDYIRLGTSGTTLCAGGHATCNIAKLTESNLAGADVVTILIGINDFVQARNGYYALGSIDSTDTSTVYGAAHMWCQRIAELRKLDSLKDTEFYFLTPVITSWNNSVSSTRNWDQSKTNLHGYTLRDLCNAIIEVCALYDIPVIDLNLVSGLYYNSADDNTVTEFGGDGAHPGTVGHQMMAKAIENRLLQNHLRDDHDHSYGSWITTRYPDCYSGEQQRVCSVCTATESRAMAGNGHTYENGLCTVCGAAHPNLASYRGKVISIMGDSISTFAGYIPVADGFNREHLPRYPQADLLTDVNETWWMQVIDGLDAKLGINDSWRGSTLCGAVSVTTGDSGENAAMSNLTRIQNLGSNGTPDVILLYGGTNDLAHVSKVGTFDPEHAPTAVDLTTKKWDNLADGFVHTLLRIRHYYPDAVIVAMLPTYTKTYYSNEKLEQGNAVMAEICEYYRIPYVDLRSSGVTAAHLPDGIHPGAVGMDLITHAVLDALLTQCAVETGEHIVYSVRHELTDAVASLGHYKGISAGNRFEEMLTGEGLTVTVTMGGVDITESCYTYGKISIEEVTGDLVITAQGKFLSEHLQPLPDRYWQINLWPALEHDDDYYTATGWGVHSSGQVRSVTIPVTPEHILIVSSFRESGANSGPVNGIRVTFFTDSGVLISMSADQVYTEFCEKGYLEVPENAVAVCVPMWKEAGGELYVQPVSELTLGLQNYTYTLDPESSTVTLTKYIGTASNITVLPRYMVEDQLYTTVLDSASVLRDNISLTSVKLAEGVKFKDDTMAYLFSGCKALETVDMTGVDTSAVTDMRYLFDWCSNLSTIVGYENWDTGAVQNMYKMFNRTGALEKIDLSAWDLSQVINSGWCFQLCQASEILLPASLKTISAGFLNHATQYAGAIFTIPSGVEKIGYAHTIYDFATNDFVEFKVADGNTNYVAIDGILYSADGTEMLAIPRNKAFTGGIYEIPEGVTFLGELSFSRNYNIETLVLPDSYVIEPVDVYDDRYVVWEDIGNLNVGTNLTIAIYCYTGIRDYVVKDTNPNYTCVDGIIYSKDMTAVVAVPTRYGRMINIPEGVTTWNRQAMWNDTEVADLYADHTVDNLLSACGGIHIPSTLVSIDAEQVELINRLHYKYADRFLTTVHESNPAYCVDENGYLQQHCFDSGICTGCGAVLGDLDLDGDVDAYDLTMLARHVGGIESVAGRALVSADIDGDGDVDAYDLTKHARFVGGIITDWTQE